MTQASDTALEFLHARATEFFTGALEASSIESAFDRRIRFESNTLKRLLPDGSGPDGSRSPMGQSWLIASGSFVFTATGVNSMPVLPGRSMMQP